MGGGGKRGGGRGVWGSPGINSHEEDNILNLGQGSRSGEVKWVFYFQFYIASARILQFCLLQYLVDQNVCLCL